jgi:DnaJ-class molecular chaperone
MNKKATKKPIVKTAYDKVLERLIDQENIIIELNFKVDNLTGLICDLVDKNSTKVKVCIACHGTGSNPDLDKASKYGHVAVCDPKCPNCKGEGSIKDV